MQPDTIRGFDAAFTYRDDPMTLSATDIVEIHQLMALYGHAADNPNEDLFPQVFTDDAVWEASGEPAQTAPSKCVGLQAIRDLFALGVPPHSPSHHTTNVYVQQQKNGEVIVRSKWIAHPEKAKGPWMGDYRDIVVRTPAGWRIQHRLVTFRYSGASRSSSVAGDSSACG